MKQIFLDTNVILDYITRRDNCVQMDMLIQLSLDRGYVLSTSLLSFANMAYILRKHTHEERFLKACQIKHFTKI